MEKTYPKYIKTRDGYIGALAYVAFGEIPVYRFEGGERAADNWELEHGSDNKDNLVKEMEREKNEYLQKYV